MGPKAIIENRKYIRVKLKRNLTIILESGEKIKADMTNISLGGVGISYPLAAETGIKLKIVFSIPTENKIIPIKADVIINYVHFSKNAFQVGLGFEELSETNSLIISNFIHKKLEQNKNSLKVVTANNKHK